MARRKKILVDNTCVEDDGFILVTSWINGSDRIGVVINYDITLWMFLIVSMKIYIYNGIGYGYNVSPQGRLVSTAARSKHVNRRPCLEIYFFMY